MVLRSKARWFVITCCLATFPADLVYAQAQPGGAAAPAKPPSKPPEPVVKRIRVCARPKKLAEIGQLSWAYDKSGRIVSKADPGGTEYLYDKSAEPKSVDDLPGADKDLRCPGDSRPVPGAEPPPAPPESIQKLVTPQPQKKGELPENVQLFRNAAQSFRDSNIQKKNFIANLLASIIVENKAIGPISPNDLSIQAAKELYSRFGEKITASMAHQCVVAPYNVQEKFTEFQTTGQWKRFALIADRWVRMSGIGTTDTAPTVILKLAQYEKVKSSVDAQTANAKTLAEAKVVYEKAYEGLPAWLEAIVPYFAPPAPENNGANAPVAARATESEK